MRQKAADFSQTHGKGIVRAKPGPGCDLPNGGVWQIRATNGRKDFNLFEGILKPRDIGCAFLCSRKVNDKALHLGRSA